MRATLRLKAFSRTQAERPLCLLPKQQSPSNCRDRILRTVHRRPRQPEHILAKSCRFDFGRNVWVLTDIRGREARQNNARSAAPQESRCSRVGRLVLLRRRLVSCLITAPFIAAVVFFFIGDGVNVAHRFWEQREGLATILKCSRFPSPCQS